MLHKNLPQAELHETKVGTISNNRFSMTGVSYVSAVIQNMAANTDYLVYTCPSGKKAFMLGRSYRNAPNPGNPVVTPNPGGGATTWGYKLTAVAADGVESNGSIETTINTGQALLSPGGNKNDISQSPSAYQWASSWNVYRTTAGGTPSSTGYIGNFTPPATFSDDGIAATGGVPNVAGAATFYTKLNDGVNPTFLISVNAPLSVGSLAQAFALGGLPILTAGQSLYVRYDFPGLSFFREILVCDASFPYSTPILSSFSAGFNVLYTVPTGKTAQILNFLFGGGLSGVSTDGVYYNFSGTSRAVHIHHVPSGGSWGYDTIIGGGNVIPNNGAAGIAHPGGKTLQTGDSIGIWTDSALSGQVALLSVLEI